MNQYDAKKDLIYRGAIVDNNSKFTISSYGLQLLASELETELLIRNKVLTEAQRKGIKDIQDGVKSPEFLYLLEWWSSLK